MTIRDKVKCSNCEWKGTVPVASDTCPNCGRIGTLAWQDPDNPEVLT